MFDGNDDKALQRNQLIAIVLMVVLVVAWTHFFMPAPAKHPPAQDQAVDATEGESAPANPFSRLDHKDAPKGDSTASPSPTQPVPGAVVLPPVAEASQTPAEDEIPLENPNLELVFTRVGARLKQATVRLGENGVDSIQLVPQNTLLSDTEALYPLGLLFGDSNLADALNFRRWERVETTGPREVAFEIEVPGYALLRKTFTLAEETHVLNVRIAYTNLGGEKRLLGLDRDIPAFSLCWEPNVASGDLQKGAQQNVVWRKDGSNLYHATSKFKLPGGEAWYNERVLDPEWAAVCSAYFTVALRPDFEDADAWYHGTPSVFRLGVGTPRTEVGAGETVEFAYQAYVGPRGTKPLRSAWPTLDTALAFFTSVTIMDQFAKLLLTVLVWFHDNIVANYGLAIIFLTVLVRMVMFPLTWKSMLSMRKMSLLAPEMEKIKQECKEDQQEMTKRVTALYRERGVSPLGGCLPMLLQMPVFIALYRMLWSAYELRRAPFIFWMQDLSEPDRFLTLPFSIPIPFSSTPLETLNLLPVLMALAMVISQKLMPMSGPAQTSQQKTMMTIMPVFFSVITYNMASGLNLYILVSTLLGIAQNYFIRNIPMDSEAVQPKKKPARPRHFYDAVRAKQREINKEVRKRKQRERRRKDSKDSK
ncbi:MAG TPA: membrane protein insertase YidC [Candidatus Hydrogenedentes bacterium]|nr:membrane protein insertase YidC [Candidatus Hydrogenedentota bacterium]